MDGENLYRPPLLIARDTALTFFLPPPVDKQPEGGGQYHVIVPRCITIVLLIMNFYTFSPSKQTIMKVCLQYGEWFSFKAVKLLPTVRHHRFI